MRIAFVGKKASGKTFAAHYLYKNHNFKTARLQDGVTKLVKWFYMYRSHKRVSWETKLQFYDALYKLDPDIHVDYLLRKINKGFRDVVVDDVRYANEVTKLKANGFIIVRVNMPDDKRKHLVGMRHAAKDSVMVNEYFSSTADSYPVDHSIINSNKEALAKLLDNLVRRERDREKPR